MNQKNIEKDLETTAVVSPVVIAAGVAAFAGVGYLLWRNRSKIQKFFKEQDLGSTLNHMGETVNGLLHHDVKPLTSNIQSAMDNKLQHAAK